MGERASYVTLITILVIAAVAGNVLRVHEAPAAGAVNLDAVALAGGAGYTEEALSGEFLDVLNAERVLFRTYQGDDAQPVWVFLGYFSRQKEGSQVHSPRHCYPGSGWSIMAESAVPVAWSQKDVAGLVVSDGNEQRLVHFWYQTPDAVMNDVFDLKRHLTKNAILGRAQEVVFTRISTPLGDNPEVAARRLELFAADIHAQVGGLYSQRGDGGKR